MSVSQTVIKGGGLPPSLVPQDPRYALEDAVLQPRTLEAVLEALSARESHDLVFGAWGLGRTHRDARRVGINLYGPPGTGKTMVAHGIASRLAKRIMCVSYADIESKFVGDTPKNLTVLFRTAKDEDAVLFFDEADAILSRRLTNMSNATDTSVNQTRSVLLALLNDFDGVIVFATNFISNYDPAFMRRMLAHVRFDLPDLERRRILLGGLIPPEMPTDARPEALAAASEGLSGGDLANAVLLGALRGARGGERFVRESYILEAMGGIRESLAANAAVRGAPS
jgi:ATP-dependent 26S proteasome regulatory subunit